MATLDEPLIQVTSGGTLTYYHANYQGSIVGVSSAAGAIVNKNSYGPFGESAAIAGTTFGFTGQRYDTDTGLYYYKMRYYSPPTGRFLQPDPLKYFDELNLYTYVSNSPLNIIDPMGLAKSGAVPSNPQDGTPDTGGSPSTGNGSGGTGVNPPIAGLNYLTLDMGVGWEPIDQTHFNGVLVSYKIPPAPKTPPYEDTPYVPTTPPPIPDKGKPGRRRAGTVPPPPPYQPMPVTGLPDPFTPPKTPRKGPYVPPFPQTPPTDLGQPPSLTTIHDPIDTEPPIHVII